MLSPVQYEQAKIAIFGYEVMNGIDREHRDGRKPVAQRAAISQKISLARSQAGSFSHRRGGNAATRAWQLAAMH